MGSSIRCCLLFLVLAFISLCHASNCPTYSQALTALTNMCGGSTTQGTYASPGCSMFRLCNDMALSPPIAPQLCDNTLLLNTVCMYNTAASECMDYMTSLGSNAMGCMAGDSLSLYNTSAIQSAVNDLCMGSMSMSMSQCDDCSMMSCPDPLGTLSSLCLSMSMSGCELWTEFCAAETASNVATLCLSSSSYPPDCVVNPTMMSCMSYNYPDASATSDITSLCDSMSDMPACSLWSACQDGDTSSSTYCAPMTILASLCDEMPTMTACHNYVQMCNTSGSMVTQCTSYPAIPSLPSLSAVQSAITSSCDAMQMSACSTCTTVSCLNPLSTLAQLCQSMSMSSCSIYEDWCTATNDAFTSYCTDGDYTYTPDMVNYFHQRFQDTILWSSWVPQTRGEYVGSIFAILGFGTVSIGLKSLKAVVSSHFLCHNPQRLAGASADLWFLPSGMQLLENFIKAVIIGLSLCLDYFNMLVAMTFNVGLFVAVILGYVLGVIIFGHIVENYAAGLARQRSDSSMKYVMAGEATKGDETKKANGILNQVVMISTEKTEMCGTHEV